MVPLLLTQVVTGRRNCMRSRAVRAARVMCPSARRALMSVAASAVVCVSRQQSVPQHRLDLYQALCVRPKAECASAE